MLTRRALLASAAVRRRPNLLFVLADDHAGYVLGADGNRLASTPNLDRLAGEGTRFASHYCNSPVCTPSRQSFLTGQMPVSAGVNVLTTSLADGKPTLARALKASGYHTAVFGKMHFNQPSKPGLHGFDRLMLEGDLRSEWSSLAPGRPPDPSIATKPPWRPFQDPASVWLNAGKLPFPRHDEDMRGTFLARQATRFLTEHRDDPFALWVSFQEPHSPFDFPIDERGRFEPSRFPVPAVGPEDDWQIPLIFRGLTPEQKQGIIAAYYTSVAFLDRNVGRVLDHLRALNLERDTLVVYMADHGYSLGQHGRFEKHCGYDPALRVPLIIRWPGRVRAGKTIRDFTESVDVPHTILDLLGADPLPVRHGRSLRPYLEGRRPAAPRDHIWSQYLENEEAFVRTSHWKLIVCSGRRKRTDGYLIDNPTPGRYIRLYDLRRDPGEFKNVADRYPEVVATLRGKLLDRFRVTHPDAGSEPRRLGAVESVEYYLRPRDAAAS